jgi:hypothetical protein
MNESVQSQNPNDKPEKRAYGVRCWNCEKMIQVDFVDLPIGAQNGDLIAKLEQEQKLGDYQTCVHLCNDGSECGSSNQVTKESAELLGSSDLEPTQLLDDPFAE